MICLKIILLILVVTSQILLVVSQEHCLIEHFERKGDSLYTCDFNRINSDFKCVYFLGLPNVRMCGEVGLRYKLLPTIRDNFSIKRSSISLRYFFNKSQELESRNIEIDDKQVWNHWTKDICADFEAGMNLYVQSSIISLDRILIFINWQEIQREDDDKIKHNTSNCNEQTISSICDPQVQYFGWKVTAIILIIVTIGSLILVISLSVTMPYNVWDKPKIQMLPMRLTDGAMTANQL
ncbi:hypothetical protein Bhyg_14696 [Pseudolycoriella hygida]|uniref:Uncharacterized protein n=1 Tax=Pseudolycoriella hygida TaxID=35572 RepID=A0A9Q0MSE2_9DIPT|nr:hypothetical protein Bhyg_14696 [Pseudolycoriella hygida]